MKLFLLLLTLVLFQDEPPMKPTEEFEIKLKFEFKERNLADPNRVELSQTAKEYERTKGGHGPLPYLFLNLRVLKQAPDEERVRVVQNASKAVVSKKFDKETVIKIDLGFTDDIKDRISPHEYTVYFLTKDKTPVSKVIIYFEKDGTYLVNGQVRGKL